MSDRQDSGIRFIRDEPAARDAFGSQGLAEAVLSAIRNQRELRTIGLLGGWGTGKSTVLKFIADKLETSPDLAGVLLFHYDAWLHQSDPVRRSFLEALIEFLRTNHIGTTNKWDEAMADLVGRVEQVDSRSIPALTPWGAIILASLLLYPVGAGLFGLDTLREALSATGLGWWPLAVAGALMAAPLLIVTGVYAWWRPWGELAIWNVDFWTTHAKRHKDDSIISILVQRGQERTVTKTTHAPEPSAIEFQKMFQDINSEVGRANRRLVIVIDNLDRMVAAQAAEFWANVRSLFLGRDANSSGPNKTLPLVILPVDESAFARMYDDSAGNTTGLFNGQSFISKTFDVVFHVTRPVLSRWADYFAEQMKFAFSGKLSDAEVLIAQRVFEHSRLARDGAQTKQVTPREINTFINALAALRLQWPSEQISLEAAATYAAFRGQIDADLLRVLKEGLNDRTKIGAHRQREIAALHFGVQPDEAVQVLLEAPIKNALENGTGDLTSLHKVSGFDLVALNVIDASRSEKPLLFAIVQNGARGLPGLEPGPGNSARIESWRLLREYFVDPLVSLMVNNSLADVIERLLASCQNEQVAQYLPLVSQALGRIEEPQLNTRDMARAYIEAISTVNNFAADHSLPAEPVPVPFFETGATLLLVAMSEDETLRGRIVLTATDKRLVATLITNFSPFDAPESVERALVGLKALRPEIDLVDIVDQSKAFLRSGSPENPTILEGAMAKLGHIRKDVPSAAEALTELANQGVLRERFNERIGFPFARLDAFLCAVLLMEGVDITPRESGSWETWFDAQSASAKLIWQIVDEFGYPTELRSLVDQSAGRPNSEQLARLLAVVALSMGERTEIDFKDVWTRPSAYTVLLQGEGITPFAEKVASNDGMWVAAQAVPLDDDRIKFFELLLDQPAASARARQAAGRSLGELPANDWRQLVETGSNRFVLAKRVSGAEQMPRLDIGSMAAFDALRELVPTVATNGDPTLRARWAEIARALDRANRRTLFGVLGDYITRGADVVELNGLLAVSGKMLLEEEAFAGRSDAVIRHLIAPMVTTDGGLEWIHQHRGQLKGLVTTAQADARRFLSNLFLDLLPSLAEEAKAHTIALAQDWNLNVRPPTGSTT